MSNPIFFNYEHNYFDTAGMADGYGGRTVAKNVRDTISLLTVYEYTWNNEGLRSMKDTISD